jgi:hypothetical protein
MFHEDREGKRLGFSAVLWPKRKRALAEEVTCFGRRENVLQAVFGYLQLPLHFGPTG